MPNFLAYIRLKSTYIWTRDIHIFIQSVWFPLVHLIPKYLTFGPIFQDVLGKDSCWAGQRSSELPDKDLNKQGRADHGCGAGDPLECG